MTPLKERNPHLADLIESLQEYAQKCIDRGDEPCGGDCDKALLRAQAFLAGEPLTGEQKPHKFSKLPAGFPKLMIPKIMEAIALTGEDEVPALRSLLSAAWAEASPWTRMQAAAQCLEVMAMGARSDDIEWEDADVRELDYKGNGLLDDMLRLARQHGEDEDPDHEVGDLQDHLRQLWDRMDASQQLLAVQHDEVITQFEMIGIHIPTDEKDEEIQAATDGIDWGGDPDAMSAGERLARIIRHILNDSVEGDQSVHSTHPRDRN